MRRRGSGRSWQRFSSGRPRSSAGPLPLGAVGRDAAASGAVVREQMGEFVAQRAIDLLASPNSRSRGLSVISALLPEGGAGGAAHAGIPAHADARGELVAAERRAEVRARGFLQVGASLSGEAIDWRGLGAGSAKRTRSELAEKIELPARDSASEGCEAGEDFRQAPMAVSISRGGRFLAERKAHGRAGEFRGDAHREQDVRRAIEPTMQAEPLEAQMPARSRFMSRLSPSSPGKLTFSVLASVCSGSPLRTAAGNAARMPCQSRSRSAAWRGRSASIAGEREFRGAGHADDGGDVLGAGAALIFVRAAVLQALDVEARARGRAGPRLSGRGICARPARARRSRARRAAPCRRTGWRRCGKARRARGRARRFRAPAGACRFRCWPT